MSSTLDDIGKSYPTAPPEALFSLREEGESPAIELYTTEDGTLSVEVKVEGDNVWLTRAQMARLFDTTSQNITLHIRNIYAEAELEEAATCKDFLQVRQEGQRKVTRQTKYYNLDVIISVGYRIKNNRGTRFRIWAGKILKEYLLRGYAVSARLTRERFENLKSAVRLMSRTVAPAGAAAGGDESEGLIGVIRDYVYALDTLDDYDYGRTAPGETTRREPFRATYDSAMEAVAVLREKFGGSALFANEKDDSFRSSIGQIYQTFDGTDLYPSVEEKAAMLLYLVVKNHSFTDGNKRIAAMLFLWFMDRNGILYAEDGHKRIADNALVALTLLIAESRPEEREAIVSIIVNLINRHNQ